MGMSLGCDPNKDLDHQTNNGKSADSQAKLGGSAAFRHSASWGLIWQQRDPTLLALFASSACFSLAGFPTPTEVASSNSGLLPSSQQASPEGRRVRPRNPPSSPKGL